MPLPPFIVNLAPPPDEDNTGLTSPIRFSVRDTDTFIDPGQIRVTVGYAQVRASGTQKFDTILPRTTRTSVLPGALDLVTQPTVVVGGSGVSITKTINGPQQSVYITKLDAGSKYRSFLGTALITPGTITNGQTGAVFGIENGPRNTGVYLFFERSAGTPIIRLCGPANAVGVRSPNTILLVDWSGSKRYSIVWNEVRGKVEVYQVSGGSTALIYEADISTFQTYDPTSGATPRRGGSGDVSMVYGIEGQIGESAAFANVAVTLDVGYPIFGIVRPGEFSTVRRSDETVRYAGGNPLKADVSPWFGPDDTFFANPSSDSAITVLKSGTLRLTKNSTGSMALYREEPTFLSSDVNGFMLEASFFAIPTQMLSSRITGMGFVIFDGQTVFYLGLLSGATRTVGLLRKGGAPNAISAYITPDTDLDWTSPTNLRIVVDPRREIINLYGEDITTPLMSMEFDRAALPSAADFGFGGDPAFVAFGHISDLSTLGSFELSRLTYAATYQAFEASDGFLPNNVNTDPIWGSTSGGFS